MRRLSLRAWLVALPPSRREELRHGGVGSHHVLHHLITANKL